MSLLSTLGRSRFAGPMLALSVAAFALLSCIQLSRSFPTLPVYFDDFSALLQADTYSRGRLSNPTHPMWIHFEKVDVIHHPTYVSRFPPLTGAALAVGQMLGDPITGSMFAFALASALVCWMLQGWPGVGLGGALLGGVLVAGHPQFVANWGIGYSAGALCLAGGSLVYGALPRIRAQGRRRDGWLLGLGAALLLLTRPYEGLVACLPAAFVLLGDARRETAGRQRVFRAAASATIVFFGALLFLGYYNFRTSGNPLRTPHQVYGETYAHVPDFLFQERGPAKTYNNPVLEMKYSENTAWRYTNRQDMAGFLGGVSEKLGVYKDFYLGSLRGGASPPADDSPLAGWLVYPNLPLLVLLAIPFTWRDRGLRFAAFAGLLFAASLVVETWEDPDFAAPFVPLAVLFSVVALLRVWRLQLGRFQLGIVIVVASAAFSANQLHHSVDGLSMERELRPMNERPTLVEMVQRRPRDVLVLARYGRGHGVRWEWAINEADVDSAEVVWGLELEEEKNLELVNYFTDREVWLLTSDHTGIKLVPHKRAETWKAAAVDATL